MTNRRKKSNLKNGLFSIVGIFIIVIIMFGVMCGLRFYDSKNVIEKKKFKLESRVSNVEETKIIEETSFETIGWIRVEGTNIDYPIIYSSDMRSDFPVTLESYAWSSNFSPEFHNKINITGHNIYNLSSKPKIKSDKFKRFEELMAFSYYDFAKENKYIQLTIDNKDYVYKIFSVAFISASSATSFPFNDDYNEEEMDYHIQVLKDKSIYKYDVDVDKNDFLISLITCTRMLGNVNYEFFVSGRLLRDDEKIEDYNVKTKKSYREIEKILEGDGDDEEESL